MYKILRQLPAPLASAGVQVRALLHLSPIHKVFREMEKRDVKINKLRAIELFGGTGSLHTRYYAPRVENLTIWEIYPQNGKLLENKFPAAEVKITDSYEELQRTDKKYDLIVVDNPSGTFEGHCEHFDLFPGLFRIASDTTILIINVIPETEAATQRHLSLRESFYQTNNPVKIKPGEMVERYREIFLRNNFMMDWYFLQKRGMTGVYYLVARLVRQYSK